MGFIINPYVFAEPPLPPTANLVIRYQASDPAGTGILPAPGTALSEWNDVTGGGRHLAQGTAASQPVWQPNIFGSMPGIYFDGANDYMELSPQYTLDRNSFTTVSIFRVTDPDTGGGMVLASSTNSGGVSQIQRYDGGSATLSFWNGTNANQPITKTTNPLCAITRSAGSDTVNIAVQGLASSNQSISATNQTFGSVGRLGNNPDTGGGYLLGYVAEIFIYSAAISDVERTQMRTYAAYYYGAT